MPDAMIGGFYVPGRVSRLAVLYHGLFLAAVKAGLSLIGFARTRRAIELVSRHSVVIRADSSEGDIDRSVQALATAAAFFPGRALCLEQSLVLYGCLRSARFPVRLRLGVRPFPFEAHAWVELHGKPVYEDGEKLKRFLPLPDVGS